MPDTEDMEFGIYRQQYLQFLWQHRKMTYINILVSEKLNSYLVKIDRQARERFSQN